MENELTVRVAESKAALTEVFRNPGLRKVNLALAGSIVGDWAYAVGVSVFAYSHGGATAVGAFGVVRYLSMATAAPFMSMLADHHDRRRVMVISDLIRFALVAAAGLVIATDGPALVVYALGLLTSVVATAFRPAQMALLPSLATHPGELTAANVAASTIESIGFFAGPAMAGLLLAVADIPVVFGFNAITFLWSAALVASMQRPEPVDAAPDEAEDAEDAASDQDDDGPHSILHGASAGFREIFRNRDLTLLMGLYCAQTLVAGASLVFSVSIALDLLDMQEASVGLLDAVLGIGGLVGGFVALVLATRGRLAVDFGIGVLLWSAPLLLVSARPELGAVLLMMALLGLGNSLVDINAFTIMQRLVPDEVMGRVFGAMESALIAGMALGSLAMPLLINTVGLRTGLFVIGGSVGALALLSIAPLRRIDTIALAPEGLDLIRAVPLFTPLPERSIERLARSAVVVRFAAGETVLTKGEAGDRFYVVESGRAEIVVSDDLSTFEEPGGSFGEIALLRDVPRQATVIATTDLVLRAIERRVFLAVVTGHEETEAEADRMISRILVGS
ncbi:MAG: MFS transporter [Acidimicrobiales bacterium]